MDMLWNEANLVTDLHSETRNDRDFQDIDTCKGKATQIYPTGRKLLPFTSRFLPNKIQQRSMSEVRDFALEQPWNKPTTELHGRQSLHSPWLSGMANFPERRSLDCVLLCGQDHCQHRVIDINRSADLSGDTGRNQPDVAGREDHLAPQKSPETYAKPDNIDDTENLLRRENGIETAAQSMKPARSSPPSSGMNSRKRSHLKVSDLSTRPAPMSSRRKRCCCLE